MKETSRLFVTLIIALFSINFAFAQSNEEANEAVEEVKDQVSGIDERLLTVESDLAKLKSIKISGYVQAQFQKFEQSVTPKSTFSLRRARVKFTYEASEQARFVVQPDFLPTGFSLKDAYLQVNNIGTKELSLWVGQFNRPNYEVEYSSGQRETPERSRLIRAIYPGERGIGMKFEYEPKSIPLKAQLALLNGNFTGNQNADVDNFKDIMARVTYSVSMPSSGIGIDFGVHTYIGNVPANSTNLLNSDYTVSSIEVGDGISKTWFGGELQFYMDLLGGMALKGEYITGTNALNNNQQKDFMGYYFYLIKNIGISHQLVLKYDHYDPNTKLSGDDIGRIFNAIGGNSSSADLSYSTFTVAWQYYWDDNIRITLAYEMPTNENTSNLSAYGKDVIDNTLTLRFQSRF
jgi:phosphate-selective porin